MQNNDQDINNTVLYR